MKKALIPTIIFSLLLITLSSCGGSKNKLAIVKPKLDKKPQVENTSETTVEKKEPVILPIQLKYANILNVDPTDLDNTSLYSFIDEWMGAPYLMGGEDMEGVDCSSFAQHLYVNVYGYLLERTSGRQYDSETTDKFLGQEFIEEGDLLFFKRPNVDDETITHVGIYLKNNKFVSASGYSGPEKVRGVKISDLTDEWWQERFICAGRKPLPIYKDNSSNN
ncbi:C40 family peptidase [uncultured Marixanthomonas sp.]|uniref:C40 family peptidase n=1 Tax=uncultured Marixanthomonas sp. TaxID=757245 RepID=UPI0030D893D2|tara:strand:+ start:19987 stop:20643 length:657 start_codon:yes stop_codon:yes gene_type:complete